MQISLSISSNKIKLKLKMNLEDRFKTKADLYEYMTHKCNFKFISDTMYFDN